MTGVILFFHRRQGYGFIEQDASPEDIFFHCSGLPKHLTHRKDLEGTRVIYELGQHNGKSIAINIVPVEQAQTSAPATSEGGSDERSK